MTISKLRLIDLAIFTGISLIFDIIISQLGFLGIVTYVAVSIPFIILMYIRWGKYALISNLIIATTHLFIYDASWLQKAANALGIMALGASLLIMKMKPYSKTRIPFGAGILLFVSTYALMFLVEWSLLQAFQETLSLASHGLNHLFNFLLGLGLTLVLALQKELTVHMDPYLREKSEENIE